MFVQPGWKGSDMTAQSQTTNNTTIQNTVIQQPSTLSRAGLAKIYTGATEVKVTFEPLNAYPLITVTPYGLANGTWGLVDVTDRSFTMRLSEPQSFDLTFSWKAEASQAGYAMSFSDNTASAYDPTSGQIYGPELPQPEAATSTVEVPTSTAEVPTSTVETTTTTVTTEPTVPSLPETTTTLPEIPAETASSTTSTSG